MNHPFLLILSDGTWRELDLGLLDDERKQQVVSTLQSIPGVARVFSPERMPEAAGTTPNATTAQDPEDAGVYLEIQLTKKQRTLVPGFSDGPLFTPQRGVIRDNSWMIPAADVPGVLSWLAERSRRAMQRGHRDVHTSLTRLARKVRQVNSQPTEYDD